MNIKVLSLFTLIGTMVCSLSGCSNLPHDTAPSFLSPHSEVIDDVSKTDGDQQKADDVRISLSLVNTKMVLNQPVPIKFSVENNGVQPISLDLGEKHKENFLFTIVFPDGKKAQLPQYSLPPEGGIVFPGLIRVDPKKTYSETLFLNEWVELKQAGTYTLEGKLVTPIKNPDGKSLKVKSFNIKFELQPRKEP